MNVGPILKIEFGYETKGASHTKFKTPSLVSDLLRVDCSHTHTIESNKAATATTTIKQSVLMFLAFLFNQKRVVLFQKTITTNKISSFFAFVSLSVKPIGFFLVLCCAVFSPFREKAIAAAVRLSKW